MDAVGSYVNIKSATFRFNACSVCEAQCCDGRKGYALTPLILEDFAAVCEHFPILFAVLEGELKIVMMLNDGLSACSYLVDNRCSIYDARPPACNLYPISPFFDEIFVDTACPAVGDMGELLLQEGKISDSFYHERLENFAGKLDATRRFLADIRPDELESLTEVGGILLYRYTGTRCDAYMAMHHASLRHLETLKGPLLHSGSTHAE